MPLLISTKLESNHIKQAWFIYWVSVINCATFDFNKHLTISHAASYNIGNYCPCFSNFTITAHALNAHEIRTSENTFYIALGTMQSEDTVVAKYTDVFNNQNIFIFRDFSGGC